MNITVEHVDDMKQAYYWPIVVYLNITRSNNKSLAMLVRYDSLRFAAIFWPLFPNLTGFYLIKADRDRIL